MADAQSATFLVECESVFKNFIENLNKSGNLSKTIKAELEQRAKDFKNIIHNQSELIIELKLKINCDLDQRFERHCIEIENINKQLSVINNKISANNNIKTYSSALQSNSISFNNKNENLVVIKPKNETMPAMQTTRVVRQIAEKHKLNTGVKNIKSIAKGGIIINCINKIESIKLINKINEESQDLTASVAKKRWPKIAIYGVNGDIQENELINEILAKNQLIADYFEGKSIDERNTELKMKFKLRKKSRFQENSFVIEVSPQLKNNVFNQIEKLNIGWKACRFSEFISIIRCFKCQKFGHKSMDCKESHEVCGHCTESHKSKECPKSEGEHCCINCKRFNDLKKQNIFATNHSSFSNACESFKRIKNLVISKIDNDY
jgi:hypothetical protein